MDEKRGSRHMDEIKMKRSAQESAIRKLSARMRTEQEIRIFLKDAGYSADEIDAAVCELKGYGYLNDAHYCREYFLYAKAKGKADGRIVRELVQKGISSEIAGNVLANLREEASADGESFADDSSEALAVGRRMLRNQWEDGKAADDKFFARVGRRLAGLGYGSTAVYDVLRKLRQDERGRKESEESE